MTTTTKTQSPLINNVRYWIHNKRDHIEKFLWHGIQWNRDIVQFVLNRCETNRVPVSHFVNVGAHIGTVALPTARVVDRVTAIEANPVSFERLVANCDLNNLKNVKCVQQALGCSDGVAYLMSDQEVCPVEGINRMHNNSGGMHVFTPKDVENNARSANLADKTKQVPMTSLDKLALPRIDFMVVDIEGSEYEFLQGAQKTLARDRPILVLEIWDNKKRQRENMKRTREETIEFVKNLGYRNTLRFGPHDFLFEPVP